MITWAITAHEFALKRMPQNHTNEKSTLFRVMSWYPQATRHDLSKCWPRSMPPYGVTMPKCLNLRVFPLPVYLNVFLKVPLSNLCRYQGLQIYNIRSFTICNDNSLRLGNAYKRQWTRSSLNQMIICSLQKHHHERYGVSNHQPRDCLLNRLFRHRWKKTSKLRVTGLCAGNSPATGEFSAQRASNAKNVSIWWRHHAVSSQHRNQCCILSIRHLGTYFN